MVILHEKCGMGKALWLAKGREGTKVKGEGHSDCLSRGLSHHSTGSDAGGLDFRVRDGTGYTPPL